MEIYIAICCDRHADDDIQVFTKPKIAIQYAKDFVPEGYDLIEQKLTERMEQSGWIYLANYGVEGDHVRVEISTLIESEVKKEEEKSKFTIVEPDAEIREEDFWDE
jgi:hypothetical protein